MSFPSTSRRTLYLETYGVPAAVNAAINTAVEEVSTDPISRIAELLAAPLQEGMAPIVRIAQLEAEVKDLEATVSHVEAQCDQLYADKDESELQTATLKSRILSLESENTSMYHQSLDLDGEAEAVSQHIERLRTMWSNKLGIQWEERLLRTTLMAWLRFVWRRGSPG